MVLQKTNLPFQENVLHGPVAQQDEDAPQYGPHEKPCPSCRGPISLDMLFSRAAFEPTDAELLGNSMKPEPQDVVMADSDDDDDDLPVRKPRIRRAAKRAPRVIDSDDESSCADDKMDSDLDDFIVQDGEDEEDKDQRRAERKRQGKRKAVIMSESEESEEEGEPVIFGKIKKASKHADAPKFLPSTKMKVCSFCSIYLTF